MKEKKLYQTPSLEVFEICDNDVLTSSKTYDPFDLDDDDVLTPGGNEGSFDLPGEKF